MESSERAPDLGGPILEVLPQLLADGEHELVLEAFKKVLGELEQLKRHLAQRKGARPNEGVSRDQLKLLLDQESSREANDASEEDPEALAALRQVAEAAAEKAAEKAREAALAKAMGAKQRGARRPFPPELRREEKLIRVPDGQRACPNCGEERKCMDHDVAEILQYRPAELFVERSMREKLVCKACDDHLVRAPRVDKVVAGGQFGCSFVANLMHAKYDLGLPLHRQARDFRRLGYGIPVSTLGDQMEWGTDLLRPLHREAIEQSLVSAVMHIDGTGLPALDRDHPDGKKLGVLWGLVGADASGPKVAAYTYASSKEARMKRQGEQGPHDILALRNGITIADFDSLFISPRKQPGIIDGGCNMHARRYFVKAIDAGDARAGPAIGAYKALYQVEEEIRDLDIDARKTARQAVSAPIFDKLVEWCRYYETREPPKTPLGRAVRYLLRHQAALRRYIDYGIMPIDNGEAERGFIRVAISRKNFLFVGSDIGGERAAIAYTILGCCRIAGVDPVAYLTDILAVMSRKIRLIDVPSLMPSAWKHRQAA